MLITGRRAAQLLAARGLSLSASQQLLATGIAGRPVDTTAAQLFEADAVADLAGRPTVDERAAATVAPHGYLVARLPRDRVVAVDDAWDEQAAVLAGPWRVDAMVQLELVVRRFVGVRFPLVLTVAGFAIAGAEINGRPPEPGASLLQE